MSDDTRRVAPDGYVLVKWGEVPPWMERVDGLGLHADGSCFLWGDRPELQRQVMERRGDIPVYRVQHRTPAPTDADREIARLRAALHTLREINEQLTAQLQDLTDTAEPEVETISVRDMVAQAVAVAKTGDKQDIMASMRELASCNPTELLGELFVAVEQATQGSLVIPHSPLLPNRTETAKLLRAVINRDSAAINTWGAGRYPDLVFGLVVLAATLQLSTGYPSDNPAEPLPVALYLESIDDYHQDQVPLYLHMEGAHYLDPTGYDTDAERIEAHREAHRTQRDFPPHDVDEV